MSIELKSRKSIIGTLLMPFLFICPSLWANEPLWLSDDELSDVTGQALFNLQKIIADGSSLGQAGYTFTRLSMGASIDVNANIDLIELGNYDIPRTSDNSNWNAAGLDADIRFRNVSLGCLDDSSCVDGSGNRAGMEHFHLEDPYIEFAYKNDGTSKRELVGVRIGFDQASGWLAGTIDALSGDLEGSCKSGICGLSWAKGEIHSPRSNNLHVSDGFLINLDIPLSNLHRLPIGKASTCGDLFSSYACSATRNLYFGFQTEALNYPKLSASGKQGVAQPGFWINMQDNVNLNSSDVISGFFGNLPAFDNCRGSAGVRNGVNACRM